MGPNEVQTIQIKMFSCQERKDHTKIQVGNPGGRLKINNIKSINFLGKWYDDTLQDVNNSRRLEQKTTEDLVNINKTGFPGEFTAWIFQHGKAHDRSPAFRYWGPLNKTRVLYQILDEKLVL